MVVWINLLYYSILYGSCGVFRSGCFKPCCADAPCVGFGWLSVCQSLESGSGCPCLSSFSLFSSSLIFSSSSLSVLVAITRLVITMLIANENVNLVSSLISMPSLSCASSMLCTMIIIPKRGAIELSMSVVSLFFFMIPFVFWLVFAYFGLI